MIEVPFVETAIDNISSVLNTDSRPTVLICSNDLLAVRAMRAAYQCRLRVPQDISVTGFDGIGLGQDLTPALSTIAQPNAEMGHEGVQLLVRSIEEGRVPTAKDSITLDYEFHRGESCAQAPIHYCANS